MGLFGNNYAKAGPGVAKNAPKKKAFFHFFEIFFRKFWKLVSLNLLFLLFCIPIVTIGPAIAAMTKVLRNYAQERHAFLWMDFIDAFKKNFKQSIVVGLVDTILVLSLIIGSRLYPQLVTRNNLYYVPYVLSLSISLVALMMNFFIFPMIVSVNIPLKSIIKNSFILSCLSIKKTLITLVCFLLCYIAPFYLAAYVSALFLVLYPLILNSMAGLIVCYNSYPVIQKYVINPYYEAQGRDNPEFDYLKPIEEQDMIFEDKGGQEQPISPVKGGGKTGRVIK